MVVAAALFFASLGIIKLLRQEFIPAQDMSRFGIRFQTPVGSSIDSTEKVLYQIEQLLASRPEVDKFGGVVGGFGGGEVNSGFAFVTMKDPADRPRDPKTGHKLSQMELMGVMRQATSGIPGARVVMQDFSQRGFSPGRGGGFPVEFNIRGRDWDELGRASRVIMEKMRESGLVTDVDSDYQVGMPEVQVVPDRNKAADLGVSMATIGETVNAAIGGERIGKFKDKGRRFDIRVRLLAQQRQRPEDIERLLVRTGSGGLVRLGDIVRIEQRPTLQAITRRDRERAITLFANVAPGVSQSTAIERSVALARESLPENYRAVPSGTAKTFAESFDSLMFAMVLGLMVAYMVLASQFNAFTHPFTVLLGAAVQRERGAHRAVARRPEPERLQHARADPVDGDRQEELDPARGLHQPDPRPGHGPPRRAAAGLPDPPAADPDDLGRHDRGRPAAGARARPRRRAAAADGALDRRRHDRLDRLHPVRGPVRLQPDRRRGGVERRAQGPRRRPVRGAARSPQRLTPAMTVSRRRDVLGLAAFVVMCFGVSVLGGRATSPALAIWYPALAKPAWTPPSWVFGPVWMLLYPLVAVAGWLAWREGRSRVGTLLFLLQLALNGAWPWLFFGDRRIDLAFVCVVLLWLAILATIRAFWLVSRGAAILLVPYLAWVGFATALTGAIWILNAGAAARLP